MIEERRFLVPPELAGERLDRAVALLSGRARGWARRVIELGGVFVGGRRSRTQSQAVVPGQVVEVRWAEPPEEEPEELPRRALLLCERGVVVVDKPAGVHAQAARHRIVGTLPELVARLLGQRTMPEPVHRLDRETSGLVVLGSEPRTRARLGQLWRQGDVRKVYLAVVAGTPDRAEGTIELALARDPRRPGRMRPVEAGRGGQPAVTRYRLLDSAGRSSLLALEPLTGRTHQLRVHCAASGWPILGDLRYAPPEVAARAARLCLHAHRLTLPAAALGRELTLEAPLPADLHAVLAELGLREPR